MTADNATYQDLARRAGELVRPDVWRSGDGEADVPRAVRTVWQPQSLNG